MNMNEMAYGDEIVCGVRHGMKIGYGNETARRMRQRGE